MYFDLLGQVLSRDNIEKVIHFGMKKNLIIYFIASVLLILAYKHRLFLIADEVYQENIHLPDIKFFSFKQVLMDLGAPFNQMEMGNLLIFN